MRAGQIMVMVVLVFVGLMILGQCANVGTATPAATARTPTSQLTGTDWLSLSSSEQNSIVQQAMGAIRCPSRVTTNDLALGVTQSARTTAGQSQRVIELLAALMTLDGCAASH